MTENENMEQLHVDRTKFILIHAMHFGGHIGAWAEHNNGPRYIGDVTSAVMDSASEIFLYEIERAREETERARQREKEQATGT